MVLTLLAVVHWIMWTVEGQRHSWLTGLYWTLTVMSTLGFGDITFTSDIGRAFSVVVLLSGIVLLLIVLPFAFISFFYAPWLEARLRTRAPRTLPVDTAGHVLIAAYDSVAKGLGRTLRGRELVVIGEGTDLFRVDTPPSLHGKTLSESGIGTRSGLNVVAIETGREGGSRTHRRKRGSRLGGSW